MRMKALKSFSPGGAKPVHAGHEFEIDDATGREYETRGLALPVGAAAAPAAPAQKEGNAAAEKGPSPTAGGETGGRKPPLSSAQAPARPQRTSRQRRAGRG